MPFRVLKPFSYSEDGIVIVDLNEGDEREDFGGLEDGLELEGLIKAVDAKDDDEPDAPKTTRRGK